MVLELAQGHLKNFDERMAEAQNGDFKTREGARLASMHELYLMFAYMETPQANKEGKTALMFIAVLPYLYVPLAEEKRRESQSERGSVG